MVLVDLEEIGAMAFGPPAVLRDHVTVLPEPLAFDRLVACHAASVPRAGVEQCEPWDSGWRDPCVYALTVHAAGRSGKVARSVVVTEGVCSHVDSHIVL
jgi:hypothetical protein